MSFIVFVGDEPSRKNVNADVPFVGTKSYSRLLDWINRMNISITDVALANKSNVRKFLNGVYHVDLPTIMIEIEEDSKDRIIALGNKAYDHLKSLGVNCFKLPHPSGRNKKLNDKKYEDQVLKECVEWLKQS